MTIRQRTLKADCAFEGIGVHSGENIRVRIRPAGPNSGVTFVRVDGTLRTMIAAHARNVVDTTLATTLGHGAVRVATVEHLLAALYGLGVDNARVEVEGPEIPVLDGSSGPLVAILDQVGLEEQPAFRQRIVVRRPVTVRDGLKEVTLLPSQGDDLEIHYEISFDHPLIGSQVWEGPLTEEVFRHQLAPARTFGFLKDVQQLKAAGLALGGSLENAVVLDEESVINSGGLRFPDEFVRHKVLDAVGDLALVGVRLVGRVEARRSGHELNWRLLQSFLADPANYRLMMDDQRPSQLPAVAV